VAHARSLLTFCLVRLLAASGLVLGLLRELADESAYDRHLAAHDRPHSPAEWRRFYEARTAAKYRRPRCC
jgi:hypothetical protein